MPTPLTLDWGTDALRRQLLPLLPGVSVQVLAACGSTNTLLLERARASAPGGSDTQPCLLVAEHQAQGRGRQGKAWQSAVGASLTFSLSLPLALTDWSGLSLAVGLALADALDPPADASDAEAGIKPGTRLGLKWPNDLLLLDNPSAALPGAKLGGILIETVQGGPQRIAVVGVGLNIQPLPMVTDAAAPLSWGYASLQDLHPGLDAPAALARVAPALVRALRQFEREGFAPLRARFAARDVLLGHHVSTTLTDLPSGLADGVDSQGTLWLRVGERRVPVASGEVSLRPDTAAPAAC